MNPAQQNGATFEPLPFNEERERQILLGTLLIDARELAPRIGLVGRFAYSTVLDWARLGRLPAVRLSSRQVMFHWPTVQAALQKGLPPLRRYRRHTSRRKLKPRNPHGQEGTPTVPQE